MVHSVSRCTRSVQVKLCNSLRMHAIPERLRGTIMTRHYTNPRLPLPYNELLQHTAFSNRAFPVAASPVWKDLPPHVTAAESLPIFCSRLKTHLFKCCCPWHPHCCRAREVTVIPDTLIIFVTYLSILFFSAVSLRLKLQPYGGIEMCVSLLLLPNDAALCQIQITGWAGRNFFRNCNGRTRTRMGRTGPKKVGPCRPLLHNYIFMYNKQMTSASMYTPNCCCCCW